MSLVAPGLTSCGGVLTSSPPSDAGADAADATSDCVSPGPDAMPCSITCPPAWNPACPNASYAFHGIPEQCGANDAGDFPFTICQTLCPALPTDAGVWFLGRPLTSCDSANFAYSGDVECWYGDGGCTPGRRPAGLPPFPRDADASRVAHFLSRMAYLEEASVNAFHRLERELHEHGALARLGRAARSAARDERRHARVMTALAERAGASVPRARPPKARKRSLMAMAIENAVQGCVRETFSAAVALVQAETASDARVRSALRRIAKDEMRHAELAWDVHHWVSGRLGVAARRRVSRALRTAAREVGREARLGVHPDVVREVGVPARWRARAIARELDERLWGAGV